VVLFTSTLQHFFVITGLPQERLFTHSSTENEVDEEEPNPEQLHPHIGIYPLNKSFIILTF